MSETLAAEPLTRQLGDALQHEDAKATGEALDAISQKADQLSDVERQALSRALQRAANVGRSDPRSASSLKDAANAIAAGQPSQASLSAAQASLRDAIQAAQGQASLRDTRQRLRDIQSQLNAVNGTQRGDASDRPAPSTGQGLVPSGQPATGGTPVALDAGGAGSTLLQDPSAADLGSGAGVGAGAQQGPLRGNTPGDSAENVFVPAARATAPPIRT